MKKIFTVTIVIVFCCIAARSVAQQPRPLINSGLVLEEAEKARDTGNYKAAIVLYKTISRSDTNYDRVLDELSLTSYDDSDFSAARQYAETGLKLFPSQASDWYNLLGNALSSLGETNNALAYYDSSIRLDPNKYLAWFNKGICYYNKKNFHEAAASFEKCILIYPYYSYAHFFLGKCAEEEGDMVKAVLCYTTNLLMNPDNKYRFTAVKALNTIALVTDEVVTKVKSGKVSPDFQLQQEILLSKVALDPKYKLMTEVEDVITRQLQVLMEKLEYNKEQKEFHMQYYVPLYVKFFSENKYNLLINHIFSGLDIKSIQEFRKKNKKELEDFTAECVLYFNQLRDTRILDAETRNTAKEFYLFNNSICTGKGAWRDEGKTVTFYGPWEFYYDNGQLKSKGSFNDKEGREGVWTYYYKNGALKEVSAFVNDTAHGKSTAWFDNGNINEDRIFIKGKMTGEVKEYYYNGLLRSIATYTNGEKNGIMTGYKSTGDLEYIGELKNDKQNGKTTFYFANGKPSSIAFFEDGQENGNYQKFYENGALETEGANLKGKGDGHWREYYNSSKPRAEYGFMNGELDGEYTSYHENGKVKEKMFYTKGKLEKKDEEYDEQGRMFSEASYEKGKIRDIHYIDASGKPFASATLRNGPATLMFYNQYGKKNNEAVFSKEGVREGKSTSYYTSGKMSDESEFKNGSLDGQRSIYYKNKTLSEKLNYADGAIDGYYTSYYPNAQLKMDGWFTEGDKQGPFIVYNEKGKQFSEEYYRNNQQDGYTVYYYPDGRKDYEQLFDEGWLTKVTQFDSAGNISSETKFTQGNGELVFKHNNGKPYIVSVYRNYSRHGKTASYFFDGSLNSIQFYQNGLRDSIYKDYYYGGQLSSEGMYKRGNKEGEWKYYYENGQLRYQETYRGGDLEGASIFYNEDDSVDKEMNYREGAFDGAFKFYAEKGILALIVNYHNGEPESYTYQDKNGTLVPNMSLQDGAGLVTGYFSNGKKSAEIKFEDGEVNGIRALYFSNGNKYVEGARLINDEHGPKKIYDSNGQVVRDETYEYDNRQGPSKQYYPNGKLKAEENWYCDMLHGVCRYYNEDGRLKETRVYYYNVLQQVNK